MKKKERQQPKQHRLLMGVGIAGIILMIGVLFLVKQVASSNMNAAGKPTEGTGGEQVIRMAVDGYQYQPSTLTVNAGKPVRWVIDGTNAVGCTSYIMSQQLGISKRLVRGENIVQFTAPTQKGTYGFSCSMGMVKGTMTVV